ESDDGKNNDERRREQERDKNANLSFVGKKRTSHRLTRITREIRNPNTEIRNNFQKSNVRSDLSPRATLFGICSFGFVSSFGFRASELISANLGSSVASKHLPSPQSSHLASCGEALGGGSCNAQRFNDSTI